MDRKIREDFGDDALDDGRRPKRRRFWTWKSVGKERDVPVFAVEMEFETDVVAAVDREAWPAEEMTSLVLPEEKLEAHQGDDGQRKRNSEKRDSASMFSRRIWSRAGSEVGKRRGASRWARESL
jgi:hypothetical protein